MTGSIRAVNDDKNNRLDSGPSISEKEQQLDQFNNESFKDQQLKTLIDQNTSLDVIFDRTNRLTDKPNSILMNTNDTPEQSRYNEDEITSNFAMDLTKTLLKERINTRPRKNKKVSSNLVFPVD